MVINERKQIISHVYIMELTIQETTFNDYIDIFFIPNINYCCQMNTKYINLELSIFSSDFVCIFSSFESQKIAD